MDPIEHLDRRAVANARRARMTDEERARRRLPTWRKQGIALSFEDYKNLVEKQAGKCPICLREYGFALRVDHEHDTKRIRGLLCHSCNVALGHLKDSLDSLDRAKKYLLASREETK